MKKHMRKNLIFFQRSIKSKCRANLHDLICIMERDKHIKRSTLLYKALDKLST
jgi:hypothetical protein